MSTRNSFEISKFEEKVKFLGGGKKWFKKLEKHHKMENILGSKIQIHKIFEVFKKRLKWRFREKSV